jgi:hypothetical protein
MFSRQSRSVISPLDASQSSSQGANHHPIRQDPRLSTLLIIRVTTVFFLWISIIMRSTNFVLTFLRTRKNFVSQLASFDWVPKTEASKAQQLKWPYGQVLTDFPVRSNDEPVILDCADLPANHTPSGMFFALARLHMVNRCPFPAGAGLGFIEPVQFQKKARRSWPDC